MIYFAMVLIKALAVYMKGVHEIHNTTFFYFTYNL